MGKYIREHESGARLLGAIIGLVALVGGMFALIKPDVSVGVLAVILFICWGVRGILSYASNPPGARNVWLLVGGVLSLMIGMLCLFDISRMLPLGIVAEFFVGIWALVIGALRIANSLSFRRAGYTGIGWLLGSGIAMAILGVLLIIFAAALPLIRVTGVIIGAFMLLFGVVALIETFRGKEY